MIVNIPIQTLIISLLLLLRKMIISQLELGPPVVEPVYNSSQTSGKKAGWVPLSSVKRTLEDQMTYKTSVLIMIDCLGLQILLRNVM